MISASWGFADHPCLQKAIPMPSFSEEPKKHTKKFFSPQKPVSFISPVAFFENGGILSFI